jgi:hypothetical protein
MANSKQILQKLARNAKMLGLTVNSESQTAVVIENGANDITIGYADASFSPSVVGGVDSSVSPFLGIGVGNPGKITITCVDAALSATGMKVLALCAATANDLKVSLNSVETEIRGHSDLLGMGQ